MATDNDMSERLERVEQKVDLFKKKLDQLATKADLSEFATKTDLKEFATRADLAAFATKADLETFAQEIKNHMGIMLGDAKERVQKAAEGYGATLDRLERDLGEFRTEWKTKAEDTDRILASHVDRIVTLERVTGVSRD